MPIRVAIRHKTVYRFDRGVALSPHIFRLRPAVHCRTPIESYALRIEPKEHFINWQQDPFGNYLARVVFQEKTHFLKVDVEVTARMVSINPFDFFVDEEAGKFPFAYEPRLKKDLAPYLEVLEESPLLDQWLGSLDLSPQKTVDFLVMVNRKLSDEIGYTVRMEPGIQSCEQTLKKGTGSCRDSAWLLVQGLRRLGLAARFVSGYLVQLAADVKSLDGPSGPEADFTDLHAWCEVYAPGAGWLGLDPTSGLFAGEGHIPLACTPDPISAAPVSGFTDPCETEFEHANSVERILEDPRVTLPYSDAQWAEIDALGRQVDAELVAGDVRLTMGGEPTFVSIDDMDGAEWTTAADGAHKRRLAQDLLMRLRARFAPGGGVHFGQGKWYPGEELPRWSLTCFWRADGEPVWRDEALLANPMALESAETAKGKEKEATKSAKKSAERTGVAEAEALLTDLAERLGGLTPFIKPVFEDPVQHMWQEGNLPVNVDPLSADLDDPLERRRLARILERGLKSPAGFVLPLAWEPGAGESWGWRSCRWSVRRSQIFLIPGDSPIGLRLPLDSLFWIPPKERPEGVDPDPFAPAQPLSSPDAAPAVTEPTPPLPEGFCQTALGVEVRNGLLHLFLPPITHLEGFLDLVAHIEASAAALKRPVVLEGYPPPVDARLKRFQITPDPGVIEVNAQPSADWPTLSDYTHTLYEEARLARLGTEKFLLDGRHTGTGGGNHVTLGGATPADSPLLRRPELLGSLIAYWQRHPGLSYLFSGLFIGPTSQAPRVDEGRDDRVHELEIALEQIPEGEIDQPWIIDRLLRNILVDLTGNTHRAEFCIDKLYAPGSATGRLGLLELRAFEMPPHARMSLTQALLLRALVALFWKRPYRQPLVRWGTALHDRFMLPHFVRQDLADVLRDLNDGGYPFKMDWLEPFFEFRFPKYGDAQAGDVHLELRHGLEPWDVLGEEVTAQGTSRYVDSSVERLQVLARGLFPERNALTCNGAVLPMTPTGENGVYVAGVRFKAWSPASALHPLIPAHGPLLFDVVDRFSRRSLGGCAYHVVHPGGLSMEDFPVNAPAAESRRVRRFEEANHTPGPVGPVAPPVGVGHFAPRPGGGEALFVEESGREVQNDFPVTLDLRRRRR